MSAAANSSSWKWMHFSAVLLLQVGLSWPRMAYVGLGWPIGWAGWRMEEGRGVLLRELVREKA